MVHGRRSPVERVLGLFTEVRPGEAGLALLMTLSIFLVLTSYLMAKVLREPLILTGGGAELKSYASAFQVILLVAVLRFYAWIAGRFPRRTLMNAVYLFFMGCMVLFYLILITVGSLSGLLFFLWVGIFSLVVIAQFWSYANDIYTPEEGKRLFVLLAFGASSGGVFGPMLANLVIKLVGLNQLLLVSVSILGISLLLINFIDRRLVERKVERAAAAAKAAEPEFSKDGALAVVFRNRYLLLIALLILAVNWMNTSGEYILGKGVQQAAAAISAGDVAAQKSFIGDFYSRYFTIVGTVALVFQLFVVSRIIKYLGIRVAILILPAVALGGYSVIALFPVLAVMFKAKIAENSIDYSLNNTVRHMLFLPTSREEKYKAKVAIDSLFVRSGDVLSAGLVFVGVTWLSAGIRFFAFFNLFLALACLLLAIAIGLAYKKRTAEPSITNLVSDAVGVDQ